MQQAVSGIDEVEQRVDLMRLAEGRVNVRDQAGLIRAILADCRAGRGGTVFTLNLDHLVKLRGNGRFRAAYQRASYVSVDGAPIVGMARDLGVSLQLVTGSDLVVPLCEAAAGAGVPVFLFGASDTVRQAASARLRAVAPMPVTLRPDERGQRWLLGVSASDRSGLLYSIARVLAKYQVNLQLAKITTLGERVEDTFLIDGPALQSNRVQIEIETELLEAIAA